MKKLLLIYCLVFYLSPVWAQKINADSLVNVAISRNRNVRNVPSLSLDSLIKTFFATSDPSVRAKVLGDIAIGDGAVSAKNILYAANKLLAVAKQKKDPAGEAAATAILGYAIYNSGDEARGLKVLFKGLKLAENARDEQAIGFIYNFLGVCTNKHIASKPYFLKALQFSRAGGDSLSVAFELGNLYYAYSAEKKTDSALYYVSRSFKLAVERNYEVAIQFDLLNLGSIQPDPKIKLKYFRTALSLSLTKNNPELIERAAVAVASWYRESKQIDSALYYARKAFNASKSLLIGRKLAPAGILAALYKGRNADSALKYTGISYALRDSMYNLDKIERAHAISLAEQQKQEEI
ncbi:MAG: hypothetical protein ACREGF_05745, partial [Candidatus Saccharimonadales bacterium]